MPDAFDIVLVPDFRPPVARVFEQRTLLFLASWMEYAGASRDFPLHIACIGSPPDRVLALAKQCGALITTHEPHVVMEDNCRNKLRAFDVQGQEDHVLVLDVDTVVLSDLSPLAAFKGSIAVASAGIPRVPAEQWLKIYRGLGLPIPEDRIPCERSVLGIPPNKRGSSSPWFDDFENMYPYYNSGALFAPWDCALCDVWKDHLHEIARMFEPSDLAWRDIVRSDQAALASALEVMKQRGVAVKLLPSKFNYRWEHVYRRVAPLDEVGVYHAMGLFTKRVHEGMSVDRQIGSYGMHAKLRMLGRWRFEGGTMQLARSFTQYLLPGWLTTSQLTRRMGMLWNKHVAPLG